MSIVSNASPLINLARIGKLDLLQELYGELIIPEAVWREVVIEGAGQPGAGEVRASNPDGVGTQMGAPNGSSWSFKRVFKALNTPTLRDTG